MRLGRTATPLAALLFVGGCGHGAPRLPADDSRTVAIYAAVIKRLVNKDNTFGGQPTPFKKVFLIDAPTRDANVLGDEDNLDQPFNEPVREALRAALTDLPPVEFIHNPDDGRTSYRGLPRDNGVIITLGPILGAGAHVRVPNRLWCGGTCGQWLTYRLDRSDEGWQVQGTDGAVAIS